MSSIFLTNDNDALEDQKFDKFVNDLSMQLFNESCEILFENPDFILNEDNQELITMQIRHWISSSNKAINDYKKDKDAKNIWGAITAGCALLFLVFGFFPIIPIVGFPFALTVTLTALIAGLVSLMVFLFSLPDYSASKAVFISERNEIQAKLITHKSKIKDPELKAKVEDLIKKFDEM